ncbi:MAG TPA: LysM peptidoglycan-binding domain-containing protein [Caldilineae bacterium]|jgi:LysM repeat protein|nr:LysM peptidoglycan-binding domain-containing protein [Caldilineae bacterium]
MRLAMRLVLLPILGVVLALAFSVGARALPLMEEGIHTVRPGDTLSAIATEHGVTVEALTQLNRLSNPNAIYVGQKLRIPAQAERDRGVTAEDGRMTHIVRAGETLSTIAAEHGVAVEAIAAASGIAVSDILRVGQRLTIPARVERSESGEEAAAPVEASELEPVSIPDVYVVQPGDTLASIARKFNISPVALARANNLGSSSLVFSGRRLAIPKPKVARPRGGGKRVEVSISRQRCYVYDGDTLLYEWVCSTGRRSSPTKPGTYYIQSKIRKAYGSAWNIWMPYWLGIYWAGSTENGFHGLPWDATTGRPTWAGLVGTPITYGCIMLSNENAKILWDMAYIGMPVIIEY